MTIRWTEQAVDDLEHLHSTIAEDNPVTADNMVDSIFSGLDTLKRFPESGRPGTRLEGTRELVLVPYIVVYRVRNQFLEVLAVVHGSRKWPQ